MTEYNDNTPNQATANATDTIPNVFDVNTQNFNADVVEASYKKPIIIQFWADWCELCKQLMPNLEAVVNSKNGTVRFAKMNIDENQQLAQQMQVKSVPTVACIYQGQPVDGFTGNTPRQDVEIFVNTVIEKCPAVEQSDTVDILPLLETAEDALNTGEYMTAMPIFMKILEAVPDSPIAIGGLAKCYISIGEYDAAKQILEDCEMQDKEEIISALKALQIATENIGAVAEIDNLKQAYADNPKDMDAGFAYAQALYASSNHSQAIDLLLDLFALDKDWNDKIVKLELLKYFEILGFENPLAINGRKRLSSLMFV